MSDLVNKLKDQIASCKIIFDHNSAELEKQLLGESSGLKVTEKLQYLVYKLAAIASPHIRISSIIRYGDPGHHGLGRSFDMGNEEIAAALLGQIATDAKIAELNIDELIFDAGKANQTDRNKWNYDRGSKHPYDDNTLSNHQDHIHFSVT